ncbi:MAG TPA: hypothetical protein VJZ71_16895 [Phycisphaerae bacterium]|nr:hypothetical protein [Phycisphaerae bacterium]
MDPSTQPNDQQQQDRALLDDFQRELVIEMRQRLKAGNLDNADLCKFADKCAVFQKIANDRDKTAIARDRQVDGRERLAVSRERVLVSHQRVSAMYHIARARNDTQLEIAQLRAEAAKSKHRPDHPQRDEDDPLAPFGRKKDGTPYTEAEFDQSLNEAIRGIWGLKPINPKSYMPWEMKRAPDGTLVAPDDPAVTQIRAPSASRKSAVANDGSDNEVSPDSACRLADCSSPDEPIPREPCPSRSDFAIRHSPFAIEPATTGSSSSRSETAPARYPSEDG